MTYQEMDKAIREAEAVLNIADCYVNQMARFVVKRLRRVNTNTLRDIKRELKNFNSNTGEWK